MPQPFEARSSGSIAETAATPGAGRSTQSSRGRAPGVVRIRVPSLAAPLARVAPRHRELAAPLRDWRPRAGELTLEAAVAAAWFELHRPFFGRDAAANHRTGDNLPWPCGVLRQRDVLAGNAVGRSREDQRQ